MKILIYIDRNPSQTTEISKWMTVTIDVGVTMEKRNEDMMAIAIGSVTTGMRTMKDIVDTEMMMTETSADGSGMKMMTLRGGADTMMMIMTEINVEDTEMKTETEKDTGDRERKMKR